MRIVFFGTSEVGLPVLEALLAQHEIVHIVTSSDAKVGRKQEIQPSPIAIFADSHGIAVSKPEKVKNNPELLDFLKTLDADIFVVVSYGKILPTELLAIPPLKTVNVHFSLLPKYRGPAPIQFALLNGEAKTGTTIFILDELVDHGPILAMREMEIEPNDTFTILAERLAKISAELIIEVLPKYQSGEIIPQEQNHTEATTTKIITKEDGKVNWQTQTAQAIHNMQRAYTPWPGIWTTYKDEVMKIIWCHPTEAGQNSQKDVIPCADNTFLQLTEVQLAGKNKMTMKDFLNGHSEFSAQDLS